MATMTVLLRHARLNNVRICSLRYCSSKSKKPMKMSEDEYTEFLSNRITEDQNSVQGGKSWPDWKVESQYTIDANSTNEVTELKEISSKKQLLAQNVVDDMRSKKSNPEFLPKNIHKLDTVQLSKLLRKYLIYADENIVVLNKPYGMVAHGEASTGSLEQASIEPCLPILSKMIHGLKTSVPLILCNRLDKNTTGITVCATNKDVASDIKTLFRQHKVRRKYWLDVDTGLMVRANHQRSRLAAETYYRTLDADGGVALVEYQPFTSAKHQLRVHTSEALDCPLLGDHKYSTSQNLLPQRLPTFILKRLNIKSSRSRDQNMHLHLREIIIPGFTGDKSKPNLLVSAKLPEHMYKTMKMFGLKPGPETDFKYPGKPSGASQRNISNMEELYQDPFSDQNPSDGVQREECYAVYKPKVKVKFQTG